jgi:hypothetical protein
MFVTTYVKLIFIMPGRQSGGFYPERVAAEIEKENKDLFCYLQEIFVS